MAKSSVKPKTRNRALISGKTARRRLRCILAATQTVLELHGFHLMEDVAVQPRAGLDFEHETRRVVGKALSHYAGERGKALSEHVSEKLATKLTPDVMGIARVLFDNHMRRAAYFAHCKISYARIQLDPDAKAGSMFF